MTNQEGNDAEGGGVDDGNCDGGDCDKVDDSDNIDNDCGILSGWAKRCWCVDMLIGLLGLAS